MILQITGGSSGIGKCLAAEAIRRGAAVITLVARNNVHPFHAMGREDKCCVLYLGAIKRCKERIGRTDCYWHQSGLISERSAGLIDIALFRRCMWWQLMFHRSV